MKIPKKLIFALFSTSLVTLAWAADEYKAPELVMKDVKPVTTSKTIALDNKFKVEGAVEEGRKLASEEEEVREPSSIKKPVEDDEKVEDKNEMPKFWNHKAEPPRRDYEY